jgi:tetratricopeptide (TPR) repeat protein
MSARPFAFFGILLVFSSESLRTESLDLWAIERDLDSRRSDRSIGDLAAALPEASDPMGARPMVERFLILHRAGYEEKLAELFAEMGDTEPALTPDLLGRLASRLIRGDHWDLARRFLETNPQTDTADVTLLFSQWTREQKPPGEVDAWIVARLPGNRRFWSSMRFRFAHLRGTQTALLDEYRARLSATPDDFISVLDLAEGYVPEEKGSPRIDWLATTYRPAAASDGYRIGQHLTHKAPSVAREILTRALEIPFSARDAEYLEELRASSARFFVEAGNTKERDEIELRGSIKRTLLEALQAQGDHAAAQVLLEELASLSADGYSGVSLHLAGQIQGASGGRVIEGRIIAAERRAEHRDPADSWRERGEYYRGRQEWAEAIGAFRKAVDLSPIPKDDPGGSGLHGSDPGQMRYWCVSSLAGVLVAAGQEPEAARLLLDEVARSPADLHLIDHVVYQIAVEHLDALPPVSAESPAELWDYFARREDWSHGVERALWRIAESVAGKEREAVWDRAESLTAGKPARAATLGWVMNRTADYGRARPILNAALAGLAPGDLRASAAFTTWENHRDLKDWKAARTVFDHENLPLTPEEKRSCLATMARISLEAGDSEEALRFWERIVDEDRTEVTGLDDLIKGGLKQDLRTCYEALIAREPDCTFVSRILTGPLAD